MQRQSGTEDPGEVGNSVRERLEHKGGVRGLPAAGMPNFYPSPWMG